MNSAKTSSGFSVELLKTAAPWFAIFVGLTYGSGFLCVFTFLEFFGIREAGTDFFRAKYIHVGVLFVLLPLCILLPTMAAIALRKILKSSTCAEGAAFPLSSFVLFLNMFIVFYFYVLFLPRAFILKKELALPVIIISSLLGPVFIEWFVQHFIVPHRSEVFSRNARWSFTLVVVAGMDFWAFAGAFRNLGNIIWGSRGLVPAGALYYFLFMALIPYIFWRARFRFQKFQEDRTKVPLCTAASGVSIMLWFLAILAFAWRVYPFIPVAKAGGDYTETPRVIVKFRPLTWATSLAQTNDPIVLGLTTSNCYILVEQTATSYFLANTNDAGGPEVWRLMTNFPKIVELRRDIVDQVRYGP